MIQTANSLKGKISPKGNMNGKLNNSTVELYPELEDLNIVPKTEKQTFKSNKYGYDNIFVEAIESEELSIIPKEEEQIKEGIFKKVTVTGDSNLISDNIKKDVEIFGVKGTANVTNAKITDATELFKNGHRTDSLQDILSLCKDVICTISMFNSCNQLTDLDLSNFDTSNVTSMSSMFASCSQLTNLNLSNFDTSKVTSMSSMFASCNRLTNLNLSSFDTSNVTSTSSMFNNCNQLTDLDLSNFDTSNVTSMSYMFASCNRLTNLNLSSFDTSNVIEMVYMFSSCSILTNLDLSNFNLEKITRINNIFSSTTKLENLKSFKNLGKGYIYKSTNYSNYKLDLSSCTLLTHESLVDVINNLYDLNLTYNVAGGGTLYAQSLTLGTTNKAKLTEEEIAIATSKGWNIS